MLPWKEMIQKACNFHPSWKLYSQHLSSTSFFLSVLSMLKFSQRLLISLNSMTRLMWQNYSSFKDEKEKCCALNYNCITCPWPLARVPWTVQTPLWDSFFVIKFCEKVMSNLMILHNMKARSQTLKDFSQVNTFQHPTKEKQRRTESSNCTAP